MIPRKYKAINVRPDKWDKISYLAASLSVLKGVKIGLPEAIDVAVDHYLSDLEAQSK